MSYGSLWQPEIKPCVDGGDFLSTGLLLHGVA
jgi:hypothetical protein